MMTVMITIIVASCAFPMLPHEIMMRRMLTMSAGMLPVMITFVVASFALPNDA